MIVFFGIGFIIEIRFRIHICFDTAVHNAAAYKLLYGRNPDHFFRKRNKKSFVLYIVPIDLAEFIIVAIVGKHILHTASVIHLSKARLPPGTDMSIGTARRMFQPDSPIPGCGCYRYVSGSVFDLSIPGHVAAGCEKPSVKGRRAGLYFPVIGNQQPLPLIYKGLPLRRRFLKFHTARPPDFFYIEPFFTDGNPFKMDSPIQLSALSRTGAPVLFHLLHPDRCFKRIGFFLSIQHPIGGTDSFPHPRYKLFMPNLLPA